MKSKYLTLFENSETSKVALYSPSIISSITQGFLTKVIDKGSSKEGSFDFDCLFSGGPKIDHKSVGDFVIEATEHAGKDGEGIMKMLRKHTKDDLYLGVGFQFIKIVITTPIPIFLKMYLEWIQDEEAGMNKGIIIAGLFISINLMQIVFNQLSKRPITFALARITILSKVRSLLIN